MDLSLSRPDITIRVNGQGQCTHVNWRKIDDNTHWWLGNPKGETCRFSKAICIDCGEFLVIEEKILA